MKEPKAGPAASCVKGRVGEEEKSTREREGEKRGCINFDDVYIFVTFRWFFSLFLFGRKKSFAFHPGGRFALEKENSYSDGAA